MDGAGHLQGKWVGTFGLGMHNKAQHTHACGPNGVCVGGGGCEAGVKGLLSCNAHRMSVQRREWPMLPSVVRFLRFDVPTFYRWCQYIGLLNSTQMWKRWLQTPPTMWQLLDAVTSNLQQSTKSLLQYVWPNRYAKRLAHCIEMVKWGFDPWNRSLHPPSHQLLLSIDYNPVVDHLFKQGDTVYLQDTKVALKAEGPWWEAAVENEVVPSGSSDAGDNMLYYGKNLVARHRNAMAMSSLGLDKLRQGKVPSHPVLPIVKGNDTNGVVEAVVTKCSGSLMVLSSGFKVMNPKPLPRGECRSCAEMLAWSLQRGKQLGFVIGSVAWLHWPDHGGWYAATLQNITLSDVLEFLCADGDCIDLKCRDGHLYAFFSDGDGGLKVPYAKEPPIHSGCWTSEGLGQHCADGWGLSQQVRCDPPPNHQTPEHEWTKFPVGRQLPVRLGDVVLCLQNTSTSVDRVSFIGVLVDKVPGDIAQYKVRVPWHMETDGEVMKTRGDGNRLKEAFQSNWWQDITITETVFNDYWVVWGSNMDDNYLAFCDHFNAGQAATSSEGNGMWNQLQNLKQLLLGLEAALKVTSMRAQKLWQSRILGWRTEVHGAMQPSQITCLYEELLCQIKVEHMTEVYFSGYASQRNTSGGHVTPLILEDAHSWFQEAGAMYKDWDPTAEDGVPNFGQLWANWGGVLEYMSVFPVRLQHLSHCEPINPFQHCALKDKIVVVDVGAGVGSVMYAARRIREHLAKMEGDKRDWVYYVFEIDDNALDLIRKWFAAEIDNGNVVLLGDMHQFREDMVDRGPPNKVKISVDCTYITIQGTKCDDGDVEAGMALLLMPENWEGNLNVKETHRQLQSALRIVNHTLCHNKHAEVDFENVESMSTVVEKGIFKVFDGAARFKTILNEAMFSATSRRRLRWGNYFVLAPIMCAGPVGMWQTFLGNPEVGGKVAPAIKSRCITRGSQNRHFESKHLPLCCEAHESTNKDVVKREYNAVWCPMENRLVAMSDSETELMLGYFNGMTAPIKTAEGRKKLLAKVFAVRSQEWLMWHSVMPYQLIVDYMIGQHINSVGVLCRTNMP